MPQLKDENTLLREWGFASESTPAVVEHATLCARFASHRVGDIVVEMGLATREAVETLMRDKPANVLTLEHLSQGLPSLREHSLRVLAISRSVPYFAAIDEQWAEAGASGLSAPARVRLDELNAACLLTPDGKPTVVFSDLSGLLDFAQESRLVRTRDPVRVALGAEPLLALAPPAVVARATRHDGAGEAIRVVASTAQDNFWSATLAKTEAERTLARLLDEALMRRATDIEIAPARDGTGKVRIRIYGDMTEPLRHTLLSPEQNKEITNFLVSRSRAGDGGRLRKPADGQITYKNAASEVFIRCSFIPADRYGLDFDMVSVSLRLLPRTARNIHLEELNLPDLVNTEVRKALMRTQGLIVLAGPTNSGKSTTIAGVVGEHKRMFGNTRKRLSLEDPVERYLEGITQISVDNNFAELMRALLRHDPDLVWVGEIRDAFSAAACVRAATSGHVVLSTVHANNSILAFRAVANYLRKDTGEQAGAGASLFDLAESVSLLIGQRLVKKLCPECSRKRRITDGERKALQAYLEAEGHHGLVQRALEVTSRPLREAHPEGCKACNKTGYAGELPVCEVLPASREVREVLAQSESRLDFATLSNYRLNTLPESALLLVEEGETEFESLFI